MVNGFSFLDLTYNALQLPEQAESLHTDWFEKRYDNEYYQAKQEFNEELERLSANTIVTDEQLIEFLESVENNSEYRAWQEWSVQIGPDEY